nr:retrovirus-related Pol polyprotein LINE-1 [Tanacetum cinerariifolium]
WRLSEVIPVYKNKGDAQACSNYRENQFGFMSGRSTTEVIHLLRSLMEMYREKQRDLHMAFLDLEKAYDSVPRELVWKNLLDKGTPRRYSRVIKDMYEGAKTRGSAISPFLFTLIMDELSRGIQENIPWCMIFADDIVLIAESVKRLNNRLESWRKTLEDNGLRVSIEKTKYLRCDFSRAASGVLCDKKIPLKLKGKIYKAAIRPAMLYGSECWPITKALAFRVEVAELRMLRWTCSKTMVDMISQGVFREALDVDSIIDKIRERRLRWFGHVKRRPQSALVRRVEAMVYDDVGCLLSMVLFHALSLSISLMYTYIGRRSPGSSLFTSGFILEVGVGSVYILPSPYLAPTGLGSMDVLFKASTILCVTRLLYVYSFV